MRVADFAQPLQIALRRHEATGRAGDRLDETRRDVFGAIQIDESGEVVGQLHAMGAFAARKEILLEMRMPHVRNAGQRRAELAPVVDHARQRDAAEIDAVVGTLARDEHRPSRVAVRLVIGERDLHRRVDRFRARIGEKDVVEIAWRQLCDARRELEALGMAAQERRDEIELGELLSYGFGDFAAAVSRGAAKQAGRGIDDFFPAVVPVVHAFGADDELGIRLELAVRRERHPVLVERDRLRLRTIGEREFGMAHRSLQNVRGSAVAPV